jgi:HEAT repeat protein
MKWSRVRMNAADALAMLKDRAAVDPLIAALKDEDPYVGRQAALALGTIGDIKAVEPLLAALKEKDPIVIMAAAKALSGFDNLRALDALALALQEKHLPAIAGAYEYFIRQGQSGTESLLIDALNQFGDILMGEAYLNCGNAELAQAAEEWAASKGYTMTTSSSTRDFPRWGSNP